MNILQTLTFSIFRRYLLIVTPSMPVCPSACKYMSLLVFDHDIRHCLKPSLLIIPSCARFADRLRASDAELHVVYTCSLVLL